MPLTEDGELGSRPRLLTSPMDSLKEESKTLPKYDGRLPGIPASLQAVLAGREIATVLQHQYTTTSLRIRPSYVSV